MIDKNRQTGAIPHNADIIMVFTSFVGHHGILDQVAKAEARGVLVERVAGGMTEARNRLEELLP